MQMTATTEVLLDPGDVNVFLAKYGYTAVHDFREKPEGVTFLERNGVSHILLAENHEGHATVLLCSIEEGGKLKVLPVSLALLELVTDQLRAQVGPDARLSDGAAG